MSEVRPPSNQPFDDPESLKKIPLPERAFFEQLSGLFRSLGALAISLKVSDETQALGEKRVVSVVKSKEELIKQARRIAVDLERLQIGLEAEFQIISRPFIVKFIEPKMKEALQLIHELSKEGASLTKILTSQVLLYSKYADEKRFIRELMEEAAQATQQEIERDCKLLEHEKRTVQVNHEQLECIIAKLQELGQKKIHALDLREFFIWKSSIDQQREALLNLGFLLIDSVAAHPLQFHAELQAEEGETHALDQHFMGVYDQIKTLIELEHRALDLFELLDDRSFLPEAFEEVQEILKSKKELLHNKKETLAQTGAFEELGMEIEQMEQELAQRREQLLAEDEISEDNPQVFS
jgi:hypothetical protein